MIHNRTSEPLTHLTHNKTATGTTIQHTRRHTRDKISSHEAPIGNLTLPRVLRTPLGLTDTKIFGVAALRATWTLALPDFGSESD